MFIHASGLLFGGAKVFPLSENESDHIVDPANKHLRILIVVIRKETFANCCSFIYLVQDDSDLNRKILRRQIESKAGGIWQNAELMEADDGLTALEAVRSEMAAGRSFDFILMDYVMVSETSGDIDIVFIEYSSFFSLFRTK